MEAPHFLAIASAINLRLENAVATTRYSCYEGRYNGHAPVARRDNCDGTIYRSQDPWCCSISCTKRGGYLDCSKAEMSCGNHMSDFYHEDKYKQCRDLYKANPNPFGESHTWAKNILEDSDGDGRTCKTKEGTDKYVCVCFIKEGTNFPCNTVGLMDRCPPYSGWWCQNGIGYGNNPYGGRGYGPPVGSGPMFSPSSAFGFLAFSASLVLLF